MTHETALTTNTVSIQKACEIAKVGRRTIYNWLNAGKLDYIRTAGGSIRINPKSLFIEVEQPRHDSL